MCVCVCVHLLEVEERKASLSEVSEAARVECVLKKKGWRESETPTDGEE